MIVSLSSALLISGCQGAAQGGGSSALKYTLQERKQNIQQYRQAVPKDQGSLSYMLVIADRAGATKFRNADRASRRGSGAGFTIMHVQVEQDYSLGFPLYRLVFKPRNFGAVQMTNWGTTALARFGKSKSTANYYAALPSTVQLSADGMVKTDWTYCPKCYDSRIDTSPEGLRLAASRARNFGSTSQSFYGTVDTNAKRPHELLTGPAARRAAAAMGKRLQGFSDKRRQSKTANVAYQKYMSDYKRGLPESKMKVGNCRTENSASVGDIKSKRRAVRINRAAIKCRSRVLNEFDINAYRTRLPAIKSKETQLFAASFGLNRGEILSPEQVQRNAEKMVRAARSLAEGFRSEVSEQRDRNRKSRERSRRERASREAIFRSANKTNQDFQRQQRDVGTQQVDPSTGRVTTRSQRAAEAKRAAEAAQRRARSKQTAKTNNQSTPQNTQSSSRSSLKFPCREVQRTAAVCRQKWTDEWVKLGKGFKNPKLDCSAEYRAESVCLSAQLKRSEKRGSTNR
ncbi:hypothetical protein R2A130_0670 [Ahrensia sp. R2A130]|nr:hypothetical protein R2A130_0670 [Ahrensia sp. R2A130]